MSSQSTAAASFSSKAVHPVALTSFAPAGCELSTWAYLTQPRPSSQARNDLVLPNLVVAHANSLRIYAVDPGSGTLLLASTYDRLAGNIIALHTLPAAAGHTVRKTAQESVTETAVQYDGLLLGFAGHPQMSVVYPPHISSASWTGVLTASSIVDLTPALTELSFGSVSSFDCDLISAVSDFSPAPSFQSSLGEDENTHIKGSHLLHTNSTVAVILGGGVGIALFQLIPTNRSSSNRTLSQSWWKVASEPYILPMVFLYQQLINRTSSSLPSLALSTIPTSSPPIVATKQNKSATGSAALSTSIVSHGLGDILAIDFLPGLAEPTIVILHSNPNNGRGGLAWSGRMAHGSSSCRTPLTLTAISISIPQQRCVVLWTLRDSMPVDSWDIKAHPSNGCLVLGVNEVVYVDNCGRLRAALAVNGWVRATASSCLLSKVQANKNEIQEKDSSLALLYQKASKANTPSFMQPNPSPLPKLSIQLDGSRLVFVGINIAMVSLRDGSLFTLEIHDKANVTLNRGLPFHKFHNILSMTPTGRKVGALGMVSALSHVPILRLFGGEKIEPELKNFDSFQKFLHGTVKKEEVVVDDSFTSQDHSSSDSTPFSMGILFVGSRLGDSSLMVYGMKENVPFLPWHEEGLTDTSSGKRKLENDQEIGRDTRVKSEETNVFVSDENLTEEQMLEREEETLYAPLPVVNDDRTPIHPQVVSDDETESKNMILGVRSSLISRPQIRSMSIFDSMQVLDSLTGLGPIGPGCKGPLACSLPNPSDLFKTRLPGTQLTAVGSSTQIHPCGYNSSGGLAILHCPGMNHASTILNEIDCKGVEAVYSSSSYVFLTLDGGGCLVLREKRQHMKEENRASPPGICLEEVDISSWNNESNIIKDSIDIQTLFSKGNMLFVKEHFFTIIKSSSVILVYLEGNYMVFILSADASDANAMNLDYHQVIGSRKLNDTNPDAEATLRSYSVVENIDGGTVDTFSFACLWDDGIMSIVTVTLALSGWKVIEAYLPPSIGHQATGDVLADDEDEITQFYQSNRIVACDLFSASESLFPASDKTGDSLMDTASLEPSATPVDTSFTQDDLDLYGDDGKIKVQYDQRTEESNTQSNLAPSRYNTLGGFVIGAGLSNRRCNYLVIYYQSGRVDIFDLMLLIESQVDTVLHIAANTLFAARVWSAEGCALGVPCLSPDHGHWEAPKFSKIHVSEAKMFFTGPSCNRTDGDSLISLRSFCLLIETSVGDLNLYTAKRSDNGKLEFIRVPLNVISRVSKEEGRHATKLKRKGISGEAMKSFCLRKNCLYRFYSISGYDGLFSATSRPTWIVSERGTPYALHHRLRYAAPSGGRSLPMAGFCSDFKIHLNESHTNCFVTLHERIGRVGSQRLTFYSNLSDVFGSHGILPGGNVSIQKIPLGVTVRKIVFIDDVSISSVTHPIYALLVAREISKDQSHLHDDGFNAIGRRVAKEEREKEKVRRQVEADLGGFDVEQEWVEDIERDDVFEVETRYGRAPTITSKIYEIWLVDASGWNVMDTYQLPEFEHGLSIEIVKLSDIASDSDSNEKSDNEIFMAVGTAIVDDDGEDVSSRGRVLLLDIKATKHESVGAEISLRYEKEVSGGPVTCLHTLASENCSRLLVCAGNEITVEQWGGGKLTQVGFFHCHMQVQDVTLLKTFLLLSDAYDSIYFLVWRESDKSLTLLAKDYEPTEVYSSGMISRGGSLAFICHDDRQNLQFFSYAPGEPAARGGNKLVCRADFHLGAQTVSLQNHLCRSSLVINSANESSTIAALKLQDTFYGKGDDDVRFAVHYGTSDGGYGSIIPINENIYWRLTALQSVMSNALESDCSLSHRAWRLYRRTTRRGGCKNNDRRKGVIDGDLVLKYSNMSIKEQEDLASSIGSTVDLILDNLLEIACAASVL